MLEFVIVNNENKELVLYDNTKVDTPGIPGEIRTMTLNVANATIPDVRIDNLDVLAYMRYNQVDNELYTITSDILGYGKDDTLPDGLYEFELIVNNTEVVKETLAFYYSVTTALDDAVLENEFNIEVDQEGYSFVTNGNARNAELLSISYALYYQLQVYSIEENVVAINDTLDKLKRILTLIKPEYKF